ncbi:hypothetical protein EJB05_50371, partial [Eragrostis curvula]
MSTQIAAGPVSEPAQSLSSSLLMWRRANRRERSSRSRRGAAILVISGGGGSYMRTAASWDSMASVNAHLLVTRPPVFHLKAFEKRLSAQHEKQLQHKGSGSWKS